MIDEEWKYVAMSGNICPGGPSTWHINDLDERRVVSVTMDEEQDSEDIAIQYYRRLSSELLTNVYRIHLSDTGEVISTYTDPQNDPTYFVHYPLFSEISSPEGVLTARRDELEELERLAVDTDLVRYMPCSGAPARKVVFKYFYIWQRTLMSWKELNLWMRLPHHPNLVRFDRVVLDELEGRVVGFTSEYVSGGNLADNTSRGFKLKWLKQLIDVVDLLNLRYGIAHQDIAPRNLLVDDSTDSIKLFDFNHCSRMNRLLPPCSAIDEEGYIEEANDVKAVMFTAYELITQDTRFRTVPPTELNLEELSIEWIKHPEVTLDHPVASYRLMLQEWLEQRADTIHGVNEGDAPEAINWPSRPRPPSRTEPVYYTSGEVTTRDVEYEFEHRWRVRDRGGTGVSWERPPQRVLDKGTRVLSSGKILKW
ncbi:kinase-like domain-containing protein [Nemania sp. FL0916]|nr:kinase-like domain-containing protein [Nemania sp. FL0916]